MTAISGETIGVVALFCQPPEPVFWIVYHLPRTLGRCWEYTTNIHPLHGWGGRSVHQNWGGSILQWRMCRRKDDIMCLCESWGVDCEGFRVIWGSGNGENLPSRSSLILTSSFHLPTRAVSLLTRFRQLGFIHLPPALDLKEHLNNRESSPILLWGTPVPSCQSTGQTLGVFSC